MCYSFTTSIVSYTIGIICAIFALCTKQFVLGMLILAYVQMQLSEMLIWHAKDTDNIGLNKFGTSFGKYLLATHNIAIGLGIILSIIFISKRKLKFTDFIPILLGVGVFLFVVFYYYLPGGYPDVTQQQDPSCVDKSCQTQGNRLDWPFPHRWYVFGFLISMIILVGWIKPVSSKIFLAIMFTGIFIFSAIMMPKVVGSIFCFSTAILTPLLVFGNYILIRNSENNDILT